MAQAIYEKAEKMSIHKHTNINKFRRSVKNGSCRRMISEEKMHLTQIHTCTIQIHISIGKNNSISVFKIV